MPAKGARLLFKSFGPLCGLESGAARVAIDASMPPATRGSFPRGLRIRSGGQTGVDRAALDAALLTGCAYEGWCPKGGWAEDMPEPPGLLAKYPRLAETPSRSPQQRTEWNVRDSAATLILVPDTSYRSQGTDFTIACARQYGRPCTILHYTADEAAAFIEILLSRLEAGQALNVAGPRESESPGAYRQCLAILRQSFGVLAAARTQEGRSFRFFAS